MRHILIKKNNPKEVVEKEEISIKDTYPKGRKANKKNKHKFIVHLLIFRLYTLNI